MNLINFSYNWNGKLSTGVFTTLRLHNPGKYIVGNDYQIQLKGKAIAAATLISKFVVRLDQLTDYVCYLDTGYSKAETLTILQRMYKNIHLPDAKFDLCLLQKHKPEGTKKG